MFEITQSYQEEQENQPQEPQAYSFAKIGGVYPDGLSLIWPGADQATQKHYKCNTVCKFEAGQKVYVVKDSGSYVVLCPIGEPGTGQAVTAAGLDNIETQYRDIELRMQYTNELQYRIKGQKQWNKVMNK